MDKCRKEAGEKEYELDNVVSIRKSKEEGGDIPKLVLHCTAAVEKKPKINMSTVQCDQHQRYPKEKEEDIPKLA